MFGICFNGYVLNLATRYQVAVDAGIPFEDAVRMASESPAKVMGCFDRCGSLEDGKDADIVIMDKDFTVTGVWLQGVEYTE